MTKPEARKNDETRMTNDEGALPSIFVIRHSFGFRVSGLHTHFFLVHRPDHLDGGLEAVDVDRLGEVGGEAGLAALADVGVHPVPAEGDRPDAAAAGAVAGEAAHEVQATPVREPDVADD